jgi:hypothetical protein
MKKKKKLKFNNMVIFFKYKLRNNTSIFLIASKIVKVINKILILIN